MGEITKSNPICQTGGVKNHVNTSFKKNKKINLTAMPSRGEFPLTYACLDWQLLPP